MAPFGGLGRPPPLRRGLQRRPTRLRQRAVADGGGASVTRRGVASYVVLWAFGSYCESMFASNPTPHASHCDSCLHGLIQASTVLRSRMETASAANVVSYNAAMGACEATGHWQGALQLLAGMLAGTPQPDVVTFSCCISALEKGGQWRRALEVLSKMPSAAVSPNVITFNASISACEKGEQWQVAMHLLASIQPARLMPTVVSYSAGISACARGGQWLMALQLLSEMPLATVLPNAISFNASISAAASAGKWQQALQLLSNMHAVELLPSVSLACSSIPCFWICVPFCFGLATKREGSATVPASARWRKAASGSLPLAY